MKQHGVAAVLKARQERAMAFEAQVVGTAGLFPGIVNKLMFPVEDFRGLSIVIGKSGGYLGIAKAFDAKGQPIIIFAAAPTPLEVLFELDGRLQKGKWSDDKKGG